MNSSDRNRSTPLLPIRKHRSGLNRLPVFVPWGYFLVLIAAVFWATLGIFYKTLISVHQLTPMSIVFWRALIAAAALFIFLGFRNRGELTIKRKDVLFFLAFGLVGVAAFFVVYINAISLAGMGVAAVLMYTAPVWVTLFSSLFLGETIDRRKRIALFLAVSGSGLVGRVYDFDLMRVNLAGLLAGIGAGLGYASYVLYSKSAARRQYNAWTTLAYALGLGALLLLPLQTPAELVRSIGSPPILFWLLGIGLVPTIGGGLAFNAALQSIPASNASIVATLEPVIASLLGWVIFAERFDYYQMFGGGLIILAVVLLQLNAERN